MKEKKLAESVIITNMISDQGAFSITKKRTFSKRS